MHNEVVYIYDFNIKCRYRRLYFVNNLYTYLYDVPFNIYTTFFYNIHISVYIYISVTGITYMYILNATA